MRNTKGCIATVLECAYARAIIVGTAFIPITGFVVITLCFKCFLFKSAVFSVGLDII